jgi:hypothetical protein
MGGLVWFDKIFQAFQGPTSFIAYERCWVIFEYSHVFRSGGSLIKDEHDHRIDKLPVHINDVKEIEKINGLKINVFGFLGKGNKITDY